MKKQYKKKIVNTLALLVFTSSINANNISIREVIPNKSNTYQELELKYSLPLEIKGYTFLNNDSSTSFYGKTLLSKRIKNSNCSFKTEIIHNNEFNSNLGFGVTCEKIFENGFYINGSILPVWEKESDKIQFQYFLSKKNVFGENGSFGKVELSSFGEWNHKGNFEYGEISLLKSYSLDDKLDFNIGFNGRLLGDGDSTPKLDLGFTIKLKSSF